MLGGFYCASDRIRWTFFNGARHGKPEYKVGEEDRATKRKAFGIPEDRQTREASKQTRREGLIAQPCSSLVGAVAVSGRCDVVCMNYDRHVRRHNQGKPVGVRFKVVWLPSASELGSERQ